MFPFQVPRIRSLILRRDILSIAAIEHSSFPDPASTKKLGEWLSGPDATHSGLVADSCGHMIGYVIYRLRDKEVPIRRIGVAVNHRRKGIGTSLLAAVRELSKHRRDTMSILVDEYDLPVQLFLQKCGFRWTSTLSGQFYKSTQDRYRLVASIREPSQRLVSAGAIMGMAH